MSETKIDFTKYPELVNKISTSFKAQLQDLVIKYDYNAASDSETVIILNAANQIAQLAWDVSTTHINESHIDE